MNEMLTYGCEAGERRFPTVQTAEDFYPYRHSSGLNSFEFSLNDYDLLFVFSGIQILSLPSNEPSCDQKS